jgi:hypothetical protein
MVKIKFLNVHHNDCNDKIVVSQASAYKQGVDQLVKTFAKNVAANGDLVYPILHLYRQFAECKIKETIEVLANEIPNESGRKSIQSRSLKVLWTTLTQTIEEIGWDICQTDLVETENTIMQLHELDILGLLSGEETSDFEIQIDIFALAKAMTQIENFIGFVQNMAYYCV